MAFLPRPGFQLHTVEFGSGLTTFVAHGGWVGAWDLWLSPFELMHDRWRCISYDHRGSGATNCAPEHITPDGLVDDLFAVLDHHRVDRCVVAGESMGALTVATAVLRDPSRFAGLVLVDGIPFTDGTMNPNDRTEITSDYPAYIHSFVEACVPESDSEHLKRWGRNILLQADAESAAHMREVHQLAALRPDYASISIPTLVLHGELDRIVPVEAAQYVAAAIPGATLEIIPGAGHVPTVTRPAAVVDLIERWWAAAA